MKLTDILRKETSAILYFLSSILVFVGSGALLAGLEDILELLGSFTIIGALVLFIGVNISVFWLANMLIEKMDTSTPDIVTHLQQSCFLYAFFIWRNITFWPWIKQYPYSECTSDCFGYGIEAMFLLIPLCGIVINAVYLFRAHTMKVEKDNPAIPIK